MHVDGLIAVLIIIGLVTSISKSGKKKNAAAAQKRAEAPSPAQPKPSAVKIPYTREEWEQFLKEEGIPKPKAQPKPAAAKPEDVAKALVHDFGGSEAAYLRALTGWFELKVPVEEGWRAARRCKAMGKKLYLLSNYPDAGYHRLRERFADRFDPLFDGGCISYACHQLKPKPEIYETLIGMFGLTPSRTLFLDDTLANVEGAMRAGINGLWVDTPGKLDAFFGTGE